MVGMWLCPHYIVVSCVVGSRVRAALQGMGRGFGPAVLSLGLGWEGPLLAVLRFLEFWELGVASHAQKTVASKIIHFLVAAKNRVMSFAS